MKRTPHLNMYRRFMERNGRMDGTGLCMTKELTFVDEFHKIMAPNIHDTRQLIDEGKNTIYWGSDSPTFESFRFTPLRQTLLLFWAAYNGEL